MAFSFSNVNNAMGATAVGGGGDVEVLPDLPVIQTEGLGFLALAGDAKVQLTSKWSPAPARTASLLAIASRKGLVAAAGPDAVNIATTESVRKAFEAPKEGDSEVRPFTPQAKLSLPVRISQLAFTADEQYLILSAEKGGGLAVHEVQALTQGTTQPAFELSTSGEALRAIIPNPMPELASFCAIVTSNGNLLMANLADRKLAPGANGPVLRPEVSCAAWSTKGKQLVAGMADGGIYQMTPDGTVKGHIPKPPGLGDYHVSSITWLENHVFLVVHNAANEQDPSVYHLITRHQPPGGAPPKFSFQKLTDPVEPFVMDKVPHHTILRIKDFPPNLQDLLLVSSTTYEGIGLFTRSKTALATDKPAETITGVFTTTEFSDDSKRAQLPMSEDLTETYPIGNALDLSSKNKVYKPIPTDEIEESPGPLPGLWVLNNEGVLASWWIVYNESIRTGTTYPGMVTETVSTPVAKPAASSTSAFATSTGSNASPFGALAAPVTTSPFGAPAPATSAFGGTSTLGLKSSPWAAPSSTTSAAPAFGTTAFGSKPAAAPSFGTPSLGNKPAAPAFGQSSMIGMGAKASPWASASTGAATPAFGQSGFASSSPGTNKVFGSTSSASPTSGGFANFANKGGFGSIAGGSSGSTNVFGSGSFASNTQDISMDTSTSFPPPGAKKDAPSGLASSPFVLGTTFKADPKTANDNETPKAGSGGSLFGGGFSLSLSDAAKQPAAPETKDLDMTSTPVPTPAEEKPKSVFSNLESTTPTTTPAPARFDLRPTSGPTASSNIFGAKPTATVSNIFGAPKPAAAGGSKSEPFQSLFGTPKIKKEEEDKENLSQIPQAPVPPDTTTPKTVVKASGAPPLAKSPPEETPSKSAPEAAPLPPDFTLKKAKPEDAPLPPDFTKKPPAPALPSVPAVPDSPGEEEFSEEEEHAEEGSEDEDGEGEEDEESPTEAGSEGSGIDVTRDLSPTTGFASQTPGFSPQSSFGKLAESGFSTISRSEAEPPRTLFGEISKNAPPLFPKPVPQSPRSPSPIRTAVRPNLLRPAEPHRSVSAPGAASQLLARKSQQSQQLPSNLGFGSSQRSTPAVDPNIAAQRKFAAAKKEAEERVLVDPEDEGIQRILHSEIEPTLNINEFLVVDSKLEVVDTSAREEVPVACETLWRDINRMIDRLGLNSRSLQSFIRGHTTLYKEEGRTMDDLETPDDWVLVEGQELVAIEDELAQDLEEGRVKDIEAVEENIRSLTRDLAKLRAKDEDLRKVIMSQIDPDQLAMARSLPLSAEQAAQQNELRRAYATFSKLLAEAEEALTMLKAKITSAGGASGKAPVPTFEAIIRTINKMTTMAEKRSGDIDVLENQMRRLRLGSMGLNGSPGPSRSREGSPFATPQKRGSIFSPDRLRDSVVSTPGSYGMRGTPPRKKLSMFSEEEKKAIRTKEAKRKATLQMLRASLEKSGPNVQRLRDDD
ncbi:hypothetical protein QBC47DRAFT_388712 [Echria macrotheca]|uniref:Nucleoporin Nup159/Nup146 N-terminal domain-containing protein n=1 Tax=Echria macrotheca TaxID=438768 RepID=A0AAJ0F6M3_9PEZI|nr:hypothetical protein QBC47DRAFT_388712 [Echria macrotheca]